MTAADTLRQVVSALDAVAMAHMLVGSFASSLHGVARSTADIDLVVAAEPGSIDRLLLGLDRERFYVDEGAARALPPGDQFHVIDTTNGWKVDLVRKRDRPGGRARRSRPARGRPPVTLRAGRSLKRCRRQWPGPPS